MNTSWFQRRLAMNRADIIAALIRIFISIILLTFGLIFSWQREKSVCNTPECKREATRIRKDMNPEIEPCDNFYEFACGGYLNSTLIPDGADSIDRFSELEEKINNQLRSSLEEPISPDEPRLFKLGKILYRNCMDERNIEELVVEPALKILERYGKWPVVEGDKWQEDEFNWTKSVYTSRDLGFSVNNFISLGLERDWWDDEKYLITFAPAEFGISRNSLLQGMENEDVKAYFKRMVHIAMLLGADEERAAYELGESLDFEVNLAQTGGRSTFPKTPPGKYTEFRVMIGELGNQFPSVNWEEYINSLLPPDVRVDAKDFVKVPEFSWLQRLNELLKNTPKRVQANYALWRVADESFKISTGNAIKRQAKSTHATSKDIVTGRDHNRSRKCVEKISRSSLSIITNALYLRKYFDGGERKKVLEIVADVKEGMIQVLKKAEWMNDEVRSTTVEKAESIRGQVTYPLELIDDKHLEELYASPDFELALDDFFGIVSHPIKSSRDHSLWFTKEPMINSNWPPVDLSYSTEVGAHYDDNNNSIRISPGILQKSFVDGDRPQYMNYGAIGPVIGREISRGFSPYSVLDADGNAFSYMAYDMEKYLQKVQCIIDQYSSYTLESIGRKINGSNTVDVNMAENWGIKTAYLAYKEYVKRNGLEPKLPGLKYTPEQMFWISAANTRPEFAADFNCPAGSHMNPVDKCPIF